MKEQGWSCKARLSVRVSPAGQAPPELLRAEQGESGDQVLLFWAQMLQSEEIRGNGRQRVISMHWHKKSEAE